MNVYDFGVRCQTYNASSFSSQSTLSRRPGETTVSQSSRRHNYHTSSYFSSTVNFPAPKVLDIAWKGPGSEGQLSLAGDNQQAVANSPQAGGVMNMLTKSYIEFKHTFTRYLSWSRPDLRPASEPKPSLKPVLAACPTPPPEPEPCPKPALQPRPKPDPCTQPTLHFPGNTRYGFNSNTGNPQTSLVSAYDEPLFSVKDTDGNDTLDFSKFKQHQVINLGAGDYSSVGGMSNNVYISRESTIENAVGGSGNDRITGNASNNVLVGGLGGDTLKGQGGSNVFKYNTACDSTYDNADLLTDFKSGVDKIDLCDMANAAGVKLDLVHDFTGRPGDTIIKYNRHSGRYFLAVDMSGDCRSDFLIKSTRPFGPEDVIGLS